eukprot:g23993.t1
MSSTRRSSSDSAAEVQRLMPKAAPRCTSPPSEEEEVERLVTSGAEIEATDEEGLTPLHLASEAGHLHVVDRLTEAKADLEAELHCIWRRRRTTVKWWTDSWR